MLLPVFLRQSCLYFTGIVARSWSRGFSVLHAVTPDCPLLGLRNGPHQWDEQFLSSLEG